VGSRIDVNRIEVEKGKRLELVDRIARIRGVVVRNTIRSRMRAMTAF
jgi:hypothetical protein